MEHNHPGAYVKKILKEKKLTTLKAAEILGIGRPALTNFLNGKAELSMEMIARLEKVFGIKKIDLLKEKQEYDNRKISSYEKSLPINRYSTGNLEIRASDIELWSEKSEATAELAILLRKLINSTGIGLTKVDFPGFENSQRHGWDGEVECSSATQQIPLGISKWEFGVGQKPGTKASSDYDTRTKNTNPKERKESAFVFVTPRNWKDKKKWEAEKKQKKEWKDVRAYDASDLEQWIDQSNSAQSWFLQRTGRFDKDIWTLEGCWNKWALNTKPELNKTLFKESVEGRKNDILSWLNNPPSRPYIITADSHEEALAFLYCAFDTLGEKWIDKTIVVKSANALRKLMDENSKEIIIISSSEAEDALAGRQNNLHTIIIRHKNEIRSRDEVSLELDMPSYKAFKESLTEAGMDDDQVVRNIKGSGYSPTILRRLLTTVPSEKIPDWCEDKEIRHDLIPVTLAGSWDKNKESDRNVIKLLFGIEKDDVIEKRIAELCKKDSTLLWTIDGKVGVKSKIENLFLIKDFITEADLKNFFSVAYSVLSEEDPALELPEDKRWMAGVYNKLRNHSGYLREGICETLVLLSVNGNSWFQERLRIDVKFEVEQLITKLLKPFKQNTWLSQKNDLPRYSEAAPETFLKILEEDLNNPSPEVAVLFKSEADGLFGGCPRANLLWALEVLAWDSQNLWRVIKILAQLSQIKVEDNYGNKPINSLRNIFKSWLPQTSANLELRIKLLHELGKKFPEIAWKICMDQFHVGQDSCSPSSRPKWRNDAAGAGFGVSNKERYEFVQACVQKSLNWEDNHNAKNLGNLLERLQVIGIEGCEMLWKAISKWNEKNPSDQEKSKLREWVRRYALSTKRGRNRIGEENRKNAAIAYNFLEPKDLIWKHHWLFAESWVADSIFEIDDENYSYQEREKAVADLRLKALSEIFKQRGSEGISYLLAQSNACFHIGFYMKGIVGKDQVALMDELLSYSDEQMVAKADQFISGFLSPSNDAESAMLGQMVKHYSDLGMNDKVVRLIRNAPLCEKTWNVVSDLKEELQTRYWSETCSRSFDLKEDEISKVIENLLMVNRPGFAFSLVGFPQVLSKVSSEQIVRLLEKLATTNDKEAGHYQVQSYTIEENFEVLSSRNDISEDRLAQLEFLYIRVLEHSKYGIPNLEKNLANSPGMFMQALALAFRRNDNLDDSQKWLGENVKDKGSIASAAYSLLSNVKLSPWINSQGLIDEESKKRLRDWVAQVRHLCKENNREAIGDQFIGKIFSKSPVGKDEIWPCEGLRDILEENNTEHVVRGFEVGVYNSRGATWRGSGGNQERALAAKYRNWSQNLEYDHPNVSAILSNIANRYEKEAVEWDNREKLDKYT